MHTYKGIVYKNIPKIHIKNPIKKEHTIGLFDANTLKDKTKRNL
jgi:hypothetical protein